jgi:hypothetical protein
MKKKEKTPEEIAEKKRINDYNKAYRHQIALVKNACKNQGLRTIELQLEFMENNTFTLPNKLLDRPDTIKAFRTGIENFKDNINM